MEKSVSYAIYAINQVFFNCENPISAADFFGWYVEGENHNDTHICPECKKCYQCAHYNGATEAGTGICNATQQRTFTTNRCFNRKFKPK